MAAPAFPATDAEAAFAAPPPRLRIVHCFRSPIGGLFRHVRDLCYAQAGAGHEVGIICDSSTGGAYEERLFRELEPYLALGLRRIPMRRQIAPSDLLAARRVLKELKALSPQILHGHGAKGGASARLGGTLLRARGLTVARIYTPHGGSLHYDARSLKHRAYFLAERTFELMTDAFIFVSRYETEAYEQKVHRPSRPVAMVVNGLRPEEFEPVAPAAAARDFLYIGMMRDLKGPDVFIRALARLRDRRGTAPTAHLVGAGDDLPRYRELAHSLGLAEATSFHDPMPARQAFPLARTLVIPSRAESMPYIVLEAAAAAVPIIATRVGGIPEILGPKSGRLIPPGDVDALADAMERALDEPERMTTEARSLRDQIRPVFSVAAMADSVETAYRRALDRR